MIKKVVRLIIGWFFLALGVIGLFLPVLQGILFILVGMIILAPDVPFLHKILCRLEKRYPVLFEKAKGLQRDISTWCKKKLPMFDKRAEVRDQDNHKDADQ